MKKCAVIIGVNKTGGLPVLAAAVSGAEGFAKWAESQDFEVTLITDKNKPVKAGDIKNAIRDYVDAKIYSQIIIFFAGHGILKGPNDEHWLLSGAPGDPNEAVNVLASKYIAYNIGIPHIIIISDACRSTPVNPLITQVIGGVIFPNLQTQGKQPDIDMFFATKPGDSAYEVKDEKLAAKNYKGIFTNCMLDGLLGKVPGVISFLKENNKDLAVVFPYELKKYLEERVPIAAEEIKITLKQDPRIEITSHPPSYLAKINIQDNGSHRDDVIIKNAKPPKTDRSDEEKNLIDNNKFDIKRTLNISGSADVNRAIDIELEKLYHATGRESFETQTGFSIIGTQEFEIALNRGRFDVFHEGDHRHVRLYPGEGATTLFFIGADGTGTPLAVLPGFIGTIMVENNRVVDVNYLPSRNNNRYDEYMIRNREVVQRRAAAALAARHGSFLISGDRYSIMGTASYLRNDKALDPTLGLYAAYAYVQAGNNREIESIFEYMEQEPEPVLFDVKLLATLKNPERIRSEKPHAPFCPMLSQGWSYLPINEQMNTPQLKELTQYLIPGLWTTFTKKGIQTLRDGFH